MQTLSSISNFCARGPAGIKRVLFIAASDVVGLYFDELDRIDGIALKAGASFKEAFFDLDSAKVSQTESRADGFPKVSQTLTIQHNGINSQVLRAIKRLADHGKVHFIAVTNQDQAFYFGINYFPELGRESWESAENSSVSRGRASVGSVGGRVIMETVLQAQTRFFAPEVDLDFATIDVDPIPDPDPDSDLTAPLALVFSPPDDGVGISITPAVFVIFNEPIKSALVGGTLTIYDFDTDVAVATFYLDQPGQVEFSSLDNSLRVISTGWFLAYDTHYYIEVTPGGVEDLAGNDWGGVTVKADWDFWTGSAPDVTAPTLLSLTPPDESVGVDPVGLSLVLEFDEDVAAGIGVFEIYDDSNDALVATIDVNSALSTILGDTVTLDATGLLSVDNHYYILVGPGVVADLAGNPWPGFSDKEDWDFETDDITPPTPLAYFPAQFSTNNAKGTAMYIDFGEVVQLGTGTIKLVETDDFSGPDDEGGTDPVYHTWDAATSPDLVLSNGDTRLNFTNAPVLDYSKSYYFVIPAASVTDAAGNEIPFHHVSDPGLEAIWIFSVAASIDTIYLNPTNGATGVQCQVNPTANFGYTRSFLGRKGWIKVFDFDTEELLAWYDNEGAGSYGYGGEGELDANFVIGANFDGDDVTLQDIPHGSTGHVYITMTPGIVQDPIHGDFLTVPEVKGDWHFTFASGGSAPTVVSTSPGSGGVFSVTDGDGSGGYIELLFEFDLNVRRRDFRFSPSQKFITIKDFESGIDVIKINVGDTRHVRWEIDNAGTAGTPNWAIILPEGALEITKKYSIRIDAGAFVTACNVDSAELIDGDWLVEGASFFAQGIANDEIGSAGIGP